MYHEMRQARYWLCTIPASSFRVPTTLPSELVYLRGQREIGERTGYEHWQLVVVLRRKGTLGTVRSIFGKDGHYEASRSDAALRYVWKEETAVPETRFELGTLPVNRASPTDWDRVWDSAVAGRILDIPADIRVRCYTQLTRIATGFARGVAVERTCRVYCGPTGLGKSKLAWEEAGLEAYPKDPRSKWWDGYQGERNVVLDEFRGDIDIAHILRWLDRYPVLVETKGGSTALRAECIWITSNLHPRSWYPNLDQLTVDALLRRLEIKEFQ